MKLVALSQSQFFEAYPDHSNAFGSQKFISLNADKVANIIGLSLVNDKQKHVVGLIAGERADLSLACPFSAPFGEICCDSAVSLETLQTFFAELKTWLAGRSLSLVLPPLAYNINLLSKCITAALPHVRQAYFDLSYHYDTERVLDFKAHLHRSARYNYNRAQKNNFTFHETDDIARAYEVIRINRAQHGYHLSMTLDQVLATAAQAIDVDAFILSCGNIDVASAIVFHVAPHIVQVVYWGDNAEHTHLHPMNILPYRIFKHYHNAGIPLVDLGTAYLPTPASGNSGLPSANSGLPSANSGLPSANSGLPSANSGTNIKSGLPDSTATVPTSSPACRTAHTPNLTLAAYKDSIGATTTPKPTLIL